MLELLDNQQKIKGLIDDIDVYKEKVSKAMMQIRQIQDSVTELKVKNEDQENNIHDIKKKITDAQIRVHDVQDRVYDILAKQDAKLGEQSAQIRDLQVRVKDIQDRVYDLLWQQKTTNYQRDLMFWQLYRKEKEDLIDAKLRFFHSLPKAEGYERKSQILLANLLNKIHKVCEENGLQYWLNFGSLIGAIRHGGFIPWDDDIDLGMLRSDAEKLIAILKDDKELFVRYIFANSKENGVHRLCQVRWYDTEENQFVAYIDIFLYDYCLNIDNKLWNYTLEQRKKLMIESQAYPVKSVNTKVLTEGNVQSELEEIYNKYYKVVDAKIKFSDKNTDHIIWGFDNGSYLLYHDMHTFKCDFIFPLKTINFEGFEFFVPNKYFEYANQVYEDILRLPTDILSHKHVKFTAQQIRSLNILYSKYVERNK